MLLWCHLLKILSKIHQSHKVLFLYIGRFKNCIRNFPKLNINESNLPLVSYSEYLGLYLNQRGTLHTIIEDRRNKGWGKVSMILSCISTISSNKLSIEVGLQLRDSIIIQSLLN